MPVATLPVAGAVIQTQIHLAILAPLSLRTDALLRGELVQAGPPKDLRSRRAIPETGSAPAVLARISEEWRKQEAITAVLSPYICI